MGSPIWNVRASMIMTTFTEEYDFTGKTFIPFTTHAMSGLGATFAQGLAVQGEEVGKADSTVRTQLDRLGLAIT